MATRIDRPYTTVPASEIRATDQIILRSGEIATITQTTNLGGKIHLRIEGNPEDVEVPRNLPLARVDKR